MGHMNVMWYVGKFDEATWNLFAAMGVPRVPQGESARHGGGPAEHHLPAELLAGDTVLVRSAFLEVREKCEVRHEMCNAQTGEISAICVLTGVSIDAQTRKSCPFPRTCSQRAQALVRVRRPS